MEIADARAHRVLAYVAAVTRQGHRLTFSQVEAFAIAPDPKTKRVDPLGVGRLSMYAAHTVETENVAVYLDRLGWIEFGEAGCRLTPLGVAVLRSLNAPRLEDTDSPTLELVLDPDDAFAYSKTLGELAGLADVMIVDPYFRLAQLIDVAELGNVRRILIGERLKPHECRVLAQGLGAIDSAERPEVRIAPDLHDRFLMPLQGEVRALGTSLGGVGKRVSVLFTLGSDSSEALRAMLEVRWSSARPLDPVTPSEASPSAS